MTAQHRFDVLILGSGAAGLATALALPEHLSVALLSKGPLAAGATSWAQGGIAAVLDGDDHVDKHIQDTLTAGAGLCHPDIVRQVVEGGPEPLSGSPPGAWPSTRSKARTATLATTSPRKGATVIAALSTPPMPRGGPWRTASWPKRSAAPGSRCSRITSRWISSSGRSSTCRARAAWAPTSSIR